MAKPVNSQWDFGQLFPVEAIRKVLAVAEMTSQVRWLESDIGKVQSAFKLISYLTFAGFVLLTGCKRERPNISAQAAGTVLFPAAGVSVKVGEGWNRIDTDPGLPVCPPTLVGSQGMARAMLFGLTVSNMEAATNALHSMFEANPDTAKESYQQGVFKTASGLTGQHISYAEKTIRNGKSIETRSHSFVIQRRDGRFVAISYIVPANEESSVVCKMIEETLRLE